MNSQDDRLLDVAIAEHETMVKIWRDSNVNETMVRYHATRVAWLKELRAIRQLHKVNQTDVNPGLRRGIVVEENTVTLCIRPFQDRALGIIEDEENGKHGDDHSIVLSRLEELKKDLSSYLIDRCNRLTIDDIRDGAWLLDVIEEALVLLQPENYCECCRSKRTN